MSHNDDNNDDDTIVADVDIDDDVDAAATHGANEDN